MRRKHCEPDREQTSTASRSKDNEQQRTHRSNTRSDPDAALQRSAGNQVVQELYRRGELQPKLEVSSPNDPVEREAERVADEVMGTNASSGQDSENESKEQPVTVNELNPSTSVSQSGSGGEITEGAESTLRSLVQGGGKTVPTKTREFFESKMGENFSDVRIHTGPAADTAARALNAEAFTVGTDVVFKKGAYAPQTEDGRRLVAHEMVHVVQNRAAGLSSSTEMSVQRQQIPPIHSPDSDDTMVYQGRELSTDKNDMLETLVGIYRSDGESGLQSFIREFNEDNQPLDPHMTVTTRRVRDAVNEAYQEFQELQERGDVEVELGYRSLEEAMDHWSQAVEASMRNYRYWLTRNLLSLYRDLRLADEDTGIAGAFAEDFAQDVMLKHFENSTGLAITEIGEEDAGSTLPLEAAKALISRFVRGVIGGILKAAVDVVIGHVKQDRLRRRVIRETVSDIKDILLESGLYDIIDNTEDELKSGFTIPGREKNPAPEELRANTEVIHETADQLKRAFGDPRDLSWYRQVTLQAGIYSGDEVPAEAEPVYQLSTVEEDFHFTMEHSVVPGGETSIRVPYDQMTVIIESEAYNYRGMGAHGPVERIDDENPMPQSWERVPPPHEYQITLRRAGSGGLFGSDETVGIPRVFTVGESEYGVWHNLEKGIYYIRISRSARGHPSVLHGGGRIWVESR